jgi:hypothetical protein
MARKKLPAAPNVVPPAPAFDLQTFLDSAGTARKVTKYAKGAVIFSQGDVASDVFFVQHGNRGAWRQRWPWPRAACSSLKSRK